jgi:zinc transport system substrate-binding protein
VRIGAAAGFLLAIAGCGAAAAERPGVVVSVRPLGWAVERLAGDAVAVVALVPPGADVETFAPSPRDLVALERSRLAVLVGHPAVLFERTYLEPWLARHPGVAAVRLGGAGDGDPHLWLSPRAVGAVLPALAARLTALAPEAAERIDRAERELAAELAAFDRELAARFAASPARTVLLQHPLLDSWAREYGLVALAIEHEGKEPSPARLASLVERARAARAPAVIAQRGLPSRGARIVAAEIGARVIEVDPLAPDWLANLRRIADAVDAARFEG